MCLFYFKLFVPVFKWVEKIYKSKSSLLSNIKSEVEYKAYGRIPLKELNLKLLEKVEELILYTLEQEAKIEALEAVNKEVESLKKQMAEMQKMIQVLSKNDK